MSEEEFLNNILNWNKEDIVDKAIKLRRELLEKREEIEKLNNIINGLEKKLVASILYDNDKKGDMVLEYQEKIDKAIEYIEERYNGEVLTHTFDKCNVGELLNILKGVDKE